MALLIGRMRKIWLGQVFLQSVSYNKTNPNPRKKYWLWEEVAQNATFNPFSLGLGWPWVGEFVGFIIICVCFPIQANLVNRKTPQYGCSSSSVTVGACRRCPCIVHPLPQQLPRVAEQEMGNAGIYYHVLAGSQISHAFFCEKKKKKRGFGIFVLAPGENACICTGNLETSFMFWDFYNSFVRFSRIRFRFLRAISTINPACDITGTPALISAVSHIPCR